MVDQDIQKLREELKWIQIREEQQGFSATEKLKGKGILGYLVPVGCLGTAGILCRGLYLFFKRDSKRQQQMMRYRVGAQGITIAVAMISILLVPLMKNE